MSVNTNLIPIKKIIVLTIKKLIYIYIKYILIKYETVHRKENIVDSNVYRFYTYILNNQIIKPKNSQHQ